MSKVYDELKEPETKAGKFYLQNQRIMLTYKTHLDKKEYISWFNKEKKATTFIRLAHETGDKTHDYKHTHVLVKFAERFKSQNANIFDYTVGTKVIHPNIKAIKTETHWKNCLNYMAKEDKENKDLKVKSMASKIQRCKTLKVALDKYAEDPCKAAGVKLLYSYKDQDENIVTVPNDKMKEWEKKFLKISKKKSDRQINWIYDKYGRSGKTVWSHHMEDNFDNGWAIFNNIGRISDFTMNIQQWKSIGWKSEGMIFDFARDYQDKSVIYSALEIAIDGRATATKYEGGRIRFGKPVIWVFANFVPDCSKMSKDRWNVFKMTKKHDLEKMTIREVNKLHKKHEEQMNDSSSERGSDEEMSELKSSDSESESDEEER